MSALATLATTTLAAAVSSSESRVSLTSTSGVVPGVCLYCEQELMTVDRLDGNGVAIVQRGEDGTAARAHTSLAPVTIGRGDQFYQTNPFGAAPAVQLVSPWINVLTGEQWTAQGDETGLSPNLWWARTEYTHTVGALGVRSSVPATSAVTNV